MANYNFDKNNLEDIDVLSYDFIILKYAKDIEPFGPWFAKQLQKHFCTTQTSNWRRKSRHMTYDSQYVTYWIRCFKTKMVFEFYRREEISLKGKILNVKSVVDKILQNITEKKESEKEKKIKENENLLKSINVEALYEEAGIPLDKTERQWNGDVRAKYLGIVTEYKDLEYDIVEIDMTTSVQMPREIAKTFLELLKNYHIPA